MCVYVFTYIRVHIYAANKIKEKETINLRVGSMEEVWAKGAGRGWSEETKGESEGILFQWKCFKNAVSYGRKGTNDILSYNWEVEGTILFKDSCKSFRVDKSARGNELV